MNESLNRWTRYFLRPRLVPIYMYCWEREKGTYRQRDTGRGGKREPQSHQWQGGACEFCE